jgi:diguanylate cyclase (GGDEF)-like protein
VAILNDSPNTYRLGRVRRNRPTALAVVGLLAVLATLAVMIVLSQAQSKSELLSNFRLRGASSATFVSTDLSQQALREQQAAGKLLAGSHVTPAQFQAVVAAFGSEAAVLLDDTGRVLDVVPAEPSLLGHLIAPSYAHLSAAESGRTAVSNVVPSAVRGTPVTAVAVPYASPYGRRVFSAAYAPTDSALDVLVDHAIAYTQHEVFLVDGAGRLVASSPDARERTLAAADPALSRAVARADLGAVTGAKTRSTFTVAPVPGTSWRLVLAVPNSHLYASLSGWTLVVPWLIFAVVAVMGALLVALLARSQADRTRLARLSAATERTARTDALTGLFNRRALTEHLARDSARARRRGEPLSALMIDLDRFKETNDRFGHEAGDRVLCEFAGCLREVLRAGDVYGRWGGDEFLVLLPATDHGRALTTADRLQIAAASRDLTDIGLPDGVPLSIGAATATHCTPEDLVREADLALYEQKQMRRTELLRPSPA